MTNYFKVAAVLALSLCAFSAVAQDSGAFAPESEREYDAGTMTEGLYRQLEEIHTLIGEEAYAEAEAESRELLDQAGNNYEEAVVAQTLGHTLAAQEEYLEAVRYFEVAVRANALPNPTHYGMMRNIAQLLITSERYQEGLEWLNRYFDLVAEPNLTAYVLAATAYAELERYQEAIDAITYAIENDPDEPNESWYRVLLGMLFQLEDYAESAEVLRSMIQLWPGESDYWTQLASIYMTLKEDREALAVLAAAKKERLLGGETAWLQLVNLYMYLEIPYYGAQVLAEGLERGIIERTQEHLELLANAWYSAHATERAIDAYSAAARLSLNGEMDMRRAYLLVDQQNWADAIGALQAALEKGGLENETGDAYILLGMARYETGDIQGAQGAFREAADFDDNRRAAVQWLNFIEEEQGRQEASAGPAPAVPEAL